MSIDLASVLRATGARVVQLRADGALVDNGLDPGDLATVFGGVAIDSRSARPGDLFVALTGTRVDGHDFVLPALVNGALGCLVARIPENVNSSVPSPAEPRRRYVLLVNDPLEALQQLARERRRALSPRVVGITGSIGKTTTKDVTAELLAARWQVHRNAANLNTEIGLPLTLLELEPRHQIAVLEMGMHQPGDIALLARIAEPETGIVTNVAPIHLERLGSIERIARTKSELVAALPADGVAVLNADDPYTRAMSEVSGMARAVLVGTAPDSTYRVSRVETRGLDGSSFALRADGAETAFDTTLAGRHSVQALALAIATGHRLGMTWDELQDAVRGVTTGTRHRLLEPSPDLMVIDDTYNAAPQSMLAALELLESAPGHHVAVLGDMLELGPGEEADHRAVGARAAGVADWLITRGARAAWIAEGAAAAGLPASRIIRTGSNAEALESLRRLVAGAGVSTVPSTMRRREEADRWSVLVKGSRGMRMEEVVEGMGGIR